MHWSLELKEKSSKALEGFSGSCALCSVSQSVSHVLRCGMRLGQNVCIGYLGCVMNPNFLIIRCWCCAYSTSWNFNSWFSFWCLMSSGCLGSDPETTIEVLEYFQFHRESWLLDQMGITSSDQINVDCHFKFQKGSWNAKSYENLRWRFYVSSKDHIALPIVSTIQPRTMPKYLST